MFRGALSCPWTPRALELRPLTGHRHQERPHDAYCDHRPPLRGLRRHDARPRHARATSRLRQRRREHHRLHGERRCAQHRHDVKDSPQDMQRPSRLPWEPLQCGGGTDQGGAQGREPHQGPCQDAPQRRVHDPPDGLRHSPRPTRRREAPGPRPSRPWPRLPIPRGEGLAVAVTQPDPLAAALTARDSPRARFSFPGVPRHQLHLYGALQPTRPCPGRIPSTGRVRLDHRHVQRGRSSPAALPARVGRPREASQRRQGPSPFPEPPFQAAVLPLERSEDARGVRP